MSRRPLPDLSSPRRGEDVIPPGFMRLSPWGIYDIVAIHGTDDWKIMFRPSDDGPEVGYGPYPDPKAATERALVMRRMDWVHFERGYRKRPIQEEPRL